jgi:ERCC4-related helicase
MEKEIVFDKKYIEEFGNQILDVELSAHSTQVFPFESIFHLVKWRLKGMDENEFFWSSNYVDTKDLFEFYHVVKYECDRQIISNAFGNRMNHLDRLVARMKSEYLLIEVENQQIKKENEELKLMIHFQPGGKGYEEAKNHFYEVAKTTN